MNRVQTTTLVALVATSLLAGFANAHPRAYVNLTGDVLLAPDNCSGRLAFSQGGVCFEAGHIVPNGLGFAAVWILDALNNPVSAFHCVDADSNLVCESEHDPVEAFCGSHLMKVGEDWDGVSRILIYLDGPLFGNPLNSPCGTLSIATTGNVYHG